MSLEKEAKENVYAVLDPHIQYELTINKHGEPPTYLSLSKPLTHQRTHAFDPHNVTNEINNNDLNENRFSTFKTGPPKARRSNKSNDKKTNPLESYVCKTNNDVEYSRDPFFGITRDSVNNVDLFPKNIVHNEHRNSKNYSRMYERNNSGRKQSHIEQDRYEHGYIRGDARYSKRSWKKDAVKDRNQEWLSENDRSFEDLKEYNDAIALDNDDRPRPGKVREIASKFNRNCSRENIAGDLKKERPKPLQSYGHQAYLDHVFPDAIEI